MANRFPLVVDTSDSNKIKEIPSGDNLQLSGNSIIGVIDITGSGVLTIASVNASNITKGGIPLAPIATSGSYTDLSNTPTNISTFTNDSNYITEGSNISLLVNNAGYLTTVSFADLTATPSTLNGYGITDAATSTQGIKADNALQPGSNISLLINDAGYITLGQIQSGTLTIDVNNSGDLIGSVFGQDDTILVDGVLSSINLDETIRGNVVPFVSGLFDIGTILKPFRNLHLSEAVFATELSLAIGATINEFSTDTTLSGASNTAVPTEGAVKSYIDESIANFDTVGNFSFTESIIDTDDSSSIIVVPAITVLSDLTVENDLVVKNDVIIEGSITTDSDGVPELVSDSELLFTAATRVEITQSPFKLASFTTSLRDALTAQNGDIIYNTTTNKFQGYTNGSWVDLH